jgi:molybdopterin-binding protein
MAQVELVVADPVRLVAIVTRDAVEELGLKEGMAATAIVKSTNVMIQSFERKGFSSADPS